MKESNDDDQTCPLASTILLTVFACALAICCSWFIYFEAEGNQQAKCVCAAVYLFVKDHNGPILGSDPKSFTCNYKAAHGTSHINFLCHCFLHEPLEQMGKRTKKRGVVHTFAVQQQIVPSADPLTTMFAKRAKHNTDPSCPTNFFVSFYR
jgi:hypothetical protein